MTDAVKVTAAMQRPHIGGVYTIFYYDDLPAAAQWYEEVMGLERWLSAPGLEIFSVSGNGQLALVGAGFGSQRPVPGPNKGVILSVETEDVEGWHSRLFAMEISGTGQGLIVGIDGRTLEFKVTDPGGYIVEFFEWI